MSINLPSLQQVNHAVEQCGEPMQLFNSDRPLTTFIPKNQFLEMEYDTETQPPGRVFHFSFDYDAYQNWVRTNQENHTDHDVCP